MLYLEEGQEDSDWANIVENVDQLLQLKSKGQQTSQMNKCQQKQPHQISLSTLHDYFQRRKDFSEQTQPASLVVTLRSAFNTKELSVYANADQLLMTSKRFVYELSESVFESLEIDDAKCEKYSRDATQIKIELSYKGQLESCNYDKIISHLLEQVQDKIKSEEEGKENLTAKQLRITVEN